MYRLLTVFAVVIFSGCASNPMTTATQQELQQPASDQAQVVFMRSSFVGSAINASLYDVTGGEIKFLGIISDGTKVAYTTQPGEHVFMVVSEAADFMEAELNSGKNYFSIVTPRMGVWKARFSLWPIKADENADYQISSSQFEGWKSGTNLVQNSEASMQWYENNRESVRQKYAEYWPVWQNKSDEEIRQRTLTPEDGI